MSRVGGVVATWSYQCAAAHVEQVFQRGWGAVRSCIVSSNLSVIVILLAFGCHFASMKAIILAAGYGTRLARDIENDSSQQYKQLLGVPKPLLPIGNRFCSAVVDGSQVESH